MANCNITNELKEQLFEFIVSYVKNYSGDKKNLVHDMMKDLFNSSDTTDRTKKQYYLANVVSLIPIYIQANIFFSELNDNESLNEIQSKLDKNEVNSLAAEMTSDDWNKKLNKITGVNLNKASNTKNKNSVTKAEREKDIEFITGNYTVINSVKPSDIRNGSLIYINKDKSVETISKEQDKLFTKKAELNQVRIEDISLPGYGKLKSEEVVLFNSHSYNDGGVYQIRIDNNNLTGSNKDKYTYLIGIFNSRGVRIGYVPHPSGVKDKHSDFENALIQHIRKNGKELYFVANKKNNLFEFNVVPYKYIDSLEGKIVKKKEEEKPKVDSFNFVEPLMCYNESLSILFGKKDKNYLNGNLSVAKTEEERNEIINKQKRNKTLTKALVNSYDQSNGSIEIDGKQVFLKLVKVEDKSLRRPFLYFLTACDENGNIMYFDNSNPKKLTLSDNEKEANQVFIPIDYLLSDRNNIYERLNDQDKKDAVKKYLTENSSLQNETEINEYLNKIRSLISYCINNPEYIIGIKSCKIQPVDLSSFNAKDAMSLTDQALTIEARDGKSVKLYNSNSECKNLPLSSELAKAICDLIYNSTKESNKILNSLYGEYIYIDGEKYSYKNGELKSKSKRISRDEFYDILQKSNTNNFGKVQFRLDNSLSSGSKYKLENGEFKKANTSLKSFADSLGFKACYSGEDYIFFITNKEDVKWIQSNEVEEALDNFENNTKENPTDIKETPTDSQTELNDSNVNDAIDDYDFSGLDKSLFYKSLNTSPATQEELKQAWDWFHSNEISKYIHIEKAFDAVNSDSVAHWTNMAIVLTKGSDYTDIYHESWHSFSQLFLTKQEKIDMYKSINGRKGSFVDFNGKTVKFKDASFRQIEEYLAEEFQNYMMHRTTKETGAVKRLFQQIIDFIKEVFLKHTVYNPHDLFIKLKNNTISEFRMDRKNKMFLRLNKSISLISDSGCMSSRDTRDISGLMDIYMAEYSALESSSNIIPLLLKCSKYIKPYYTDKDKFNKLLESEPNSNVQNLIDILESDVDFNVTYNHNKVIKFLTDQNSIKLAYLYANMKLIQLKSKLEEKRNSETDEILKLKYSQQISTVENALRNYGNLKQIGKKSNKKGVIAYHFNEYFDSKKLVTSDENNDLENEDNGIDTVEDTSECTQRYDNDNRCNNKSAEARLGNDKVLTFILSTIPSYKMSYSYNEETNITDYFFDDEYNEYGIRKTKEFKKIKNRLVGLLAGCTGPQKCYERMCEIAFDKNHNIIDPVIASIVSRLGDPSCIKTSNFTDPNSNESIIDNAELWCKFTQVFARPEVELREARIDVSKEIIKDEETGENVEQLNSVNSYAEDSAGPVWKMNEYYTSKFLSSDAIVKNSTSGICLDLNKIIETFSLDDIDDDNLFSYAKENMFRLLRSLGLSITPSKQIIEDYYKSISDAYESEEEANEEFVRMYNSLIGRCIDLLDSEVDIIDPISQFFNYNWNNEYDKSNDARIVNRLFKTVRNIDIKYTEDVNTEMVKNAEGSVMFINQLSNSITQILDRLNSCETYEDVLNDPSLKHFDIFENSETFNPQAYGSCILRKMFNIDEKITRKNASKYKRNKRFSVKLVNLSGIKTISRIKDGTQNSVGQSLFDTDKSTKVIADLIYESSSLMEFMRHADKGVSYGLEIIEDGERIDCGDLLGSIFYGIKEEDFDSSIDPSSIPYDFVCDYIIDQLSVELKRVSLVKELRKKRDNGEQLLYDHKYLDNDEVLKLGVFDDMLDKKTKEGLYKLSDTSSKSIKDKLGNKILNCFWNYYKKYFEESFSMCEEAFETIDESVREELILSIFKKQFKNNFLENFELDNGEYDYDLMLKHLVRNFICVNIVYNSECLRLIYSDAMIYNHSKDDFTKRIGAMGSSGSIFFDEKWMNNFIKDQFEYSFYKQLNNDDEELTNPYFDADHVGELKTAVCADIHPLSAYAKKYNKITNNNSYNRIEEECNAQGLISFDSYRFMCIRSGKWNGEKEELFQKICKSYIDDSIEIDPSDIKKYFPVLKLQYEGPLNTGSMPLQAFHKYALMPIIPTVVKGMSVERIHDIMMQEGIDYITFNSASKLSTVSSGTKSIDKKGKLVQYGDRLYEDNIYTDPDKQTAATFTKRKVRTENNNGDSFFTPNYIPIAYMKDQVEIHEEMEIDTIVSTQMRRLLPNNLFENGKIACEDTKEAEKLMKLAKEYENNLNKLTQIAINGIKKEFGINGSKMNEDKFLDYVKKELIKKNIPEYVLDNITSVRQLEFGFYAKETEKIIIGLINKRIIRQRIHGAQYVQVASTLFENADPENRLDEGTNDLRFYGESDLSYTKDRIKVATDGNTEPATIKIPLAGDFVNLLYAKMYNEDGNDTGEKIGTLDRLNMMLKNQKWVTDHINTISVVACRIPVQGHNSMENYRIAEFLAPGSNNIVVCPSELVIKSGGDYDVDKLSIITPNIRVVDGEMFFPKSEMNEDNDLTKDIKRKIKDLRVNVNTSSKHLRGEVIKNLDNIIKFYTNASQKEQFIKANDFRNQIDEIEVKILEIEEEMDSELVDDSKKILHQEELTKQYKAYDELLGKILEVYDVSNAEKGKSIANKEDRKSVTWGNVKNAYDKYKTAKDEHDAFFKDKKKLIMNESKFGYENRMIISMSSILMHPSSLKSLLTPNSTSLFTDDDRPADVLQNNADYDRFENKTNERQDKVMSPTRIIEWRYNVEKHNDVNTGKTILGPAAIDNVFAPIAKRTGIKLALMSSNAVDLEIGDDIIRKEEWGTAEAFDKYEKYYNSLDVDDFASLSEYNKKKQECKKILNKLSEYRKQDVFLPHNTIINDNGEEVISLSNIKSKDGVIDISEILSEYINGCVDVAKGAWISYIQGNREAIPTFMFMIQSGIPIDYVCYFISNPAIVKYINAKIRNKSSLNNINSSEMINQELYLRAEALRCTDVLSNEKGNQFKTERIRFNINDRINKILSKQKEFNLSELKDAAIKKSNDPDFNQKVLAHFFQIEDMSKSMNSLKLAIRVDAAKSDSVYDITTRQTKFKDLDEDERLDQGSLSKVKSDSVLSSFFIEDLVTTIINITMPTRNNQILKDAFDTDISVQSNRLPGDAKEQYNRFFDDFKSYLYQRSIMTSSDNSDVNGFEKDMLAKHDYNDIIPYENVVNKFATALKEYLGGNDKEHLDEKVNEVIDSEMFKTYLDFIGINKEDEETIKDIAINMIVTFATHNIGYGKTMIFDDSLSFSSRINVVKEILSSNEILAKGLSGITLFNSLVNESMSDVVNDRTSHNLWLSSEITDIDKAVMYEEFKYLIEEGNLIALLNKTELSEFDKEFILSTVSLLPLFSFVQSGMSSSGRSLNRLFDLSSEIEQSYVNWTSSDLDSQIKILENFKRLYIDKYTKDTKFMFKSNSYDLFSENSQIKELSIGFDDYVNNDEPKSVSDFSDHTGGAYGADSIGARIGMDFGIGSAIHYRPESDPKSKSTSKDSEQINIDEFDSESTLSKKQYSIIVPDNQTEYARKIFIDLGIFSSGAYLNDLNLRNFWQIKNSTAVYAFTGINENLKSVEDGGTSSAVKLALRIRNSDGSFKSVFVFDPNKKSWFKYDYTSQKFEQLDEANYPILSRNFAIIGSRDFEQYMKPKDKNSKEFVPTKENENSKDVINAVRGLYERTFSIPKDKVFVEKIKKGFYNKNDDYRYLPYKNQSDVLFIVNDNFDTYNKNVLGKCNNVVLEDKIDDLKKYMSGKGYKKIIVIGNLKTKLLDQIDKLKIMESDIKINKFEKSESPSTKRIEKQKTKQDNNTQLPSSNVKINIYAGTNENADLSNFAARTFYLLQYFISDSNYQGVDAGIIYKDPKKEKTLNDWILDVLSRSNLLGNNNTSPIIVNSVENLFQAFKVLYADKNEYFKNLNNDEYFKLSENGKKLFLDILNSSPSDARRKGKYIKNLDRTSWDRDSSYLMKNIIKSSFIKNSQALQRLISTGNATLTHTQDKGKWGTEFPKLLMEVREELSKENDMGLSNNQSTPKYYEGNITPDANTIFVFGSNPEGKHGAGAAKVAVEQFGAIYGKGEGLQGNAYALPTKDLRSKPLYSEDGGKSQVTLYRGYALTENREAYNLEETVAHTALDYDDTLKGSLYFTSSQEEAEDYAKGRTDKSDEEFIKDDKVVKQRNRHYTGDYAKVSKYFISADAKVEHYKDITDYVKNGTNSTADVIVLDKGTMWINNTEYIVKNPNVIVYDKMLRSIPTKTIVKSIKKLYDTAKQNPTKQFKVAYRNTTETSLNGYTGLEMIQMFKDAGSIPSNIVFSKEWIDTGMFDSSNTSKDVIKNKDIINNDSTQPLLTIYKKGRNRYYSDYEGKQWTVKTGTKDSIDTENNIITLSKNGDKHEIFNKDKYYNLFKENGLNYDEIINKLKDDKDLFDSFRCQVLISNEDIASLNSLGFNSQSIFTEEEQEELERIKEDLQIPFNIGQQEAIIKISNFLLNKNDKYDLSKDFSLIIGQAGTGKTTVAQAIIKRYQMNNNGAMPLISCCTVSNKAISVLRESFTGFNSREKSNINFGSLAKIIGKREYQGEWILDDSAAAKKQRDRLKNSDIIIIDECSMIKESDIKDIMRFKGPNTSVLMLGDSGQIYPVYKDGTSKISPAFTKAKCISKLSERMRQGDKSPIVKYADMLWHDENEEHKVAYEPNFKNVITEDNGALIFVKPKAKAVRSNGSTVKATKLDDTITEHIIEAYKYARDQKNPNFIQYIQYYSDTHAFNEYIHDKLFPGTDCIQQGEIVVALNSVSESGKMLIENGYADVVDQILKEEEIEYTVGKYKIKLKFKHMHLLKKDLDVKVLNDEYYDDYYKLITICQNEANKIWDKTKSATPEWKSIKNIQNELEQQVALLDYGYCLNVHKSQGSTYDICIADQQQIKDMDNLSQNEKIHCAYTSATRPKHVLIVISDDADSSNSSDIKITDLAQRYEDNRKKKIEKRLKSNSSNQNNFGSADSVINVSDKDYERELKLCMFWGI